MSKAYRVERWIEGDQLWYANGPIFASAKAAGQYLDDLQRIDPGERAERYRVRPALKAELNFQKVES